MYDFFYKLKAEPDKQKKLQMLSDLPPEQYEIIWHVYCNKNMPTKAEFEAKVRTGLDVPHRKWTLLDIVQASQNNTSTEDLFAGILKYLSIIEFVYGPKECRKAARIIFQEERIGITVWEMKRIHNQRRLLV